VHNRQFISDPIYFYINIYWLTVLKLFTALKYVTYSVMCRGSELDAVSTFKIVTSINLLAPCVLYTWKVFRCSPENAFHIFNQQIYFIIWYLLDRASLI
jgi:hypothetical protein